MDFTRRQILRTGASLVGLSVAQLFLPAFGMVAAAYDAPWCTWFAGRMRPDLPRDLGNAKDWAVNAARRGFRVEAKPSFRSVVVFPPGIHKADASLGHVGFVSYIDADWRDPFFFVDESNFNDPPRSRYVYTLDGVAIRRRVFRFREVHSSVRFIGPRVAR